MFVTLSVDWNSLLPFCGVPETVLGVACGVGGAEIDGTTGVGERRLWFIECFGLVLVSLPAKENKMNILHAQQICINWKWPRTNE